MSLVPTSSNERHHRVRGLATPRRLRQDIRSAFSRHPQATLDATRSETDTSIYNERLLSGNQIRVLHIRPSRIRHRQLECELKLISLDDAPVYEALSYVWGVDPPSVPIVCNGQPLTIRPELSDALVRLRLEHTTRIIWADALCINQTDNQEKSHQVPLMGKIFSQATKVNMWLGHGDETGIKEVFKCCRLIANTWSEFSVEQDMDLNDDETIQAVEIPKEAFTRTVCSSMSELFHRPLFSRVWCVQEIVLAQDALVMWGEQELPWDDVGRAAVWLFMKRTASEFGEELSKLLYEINLRPVAELYDLDPAGTSLLSALSRFRNFQSTDPRDKVYGLISLVRSEADGDLIIPDYEKTVVQVFAEMALSSIVSTRHLFVFSHIEHHADYDGVDEQQSWAPRWDHPQTTYMIGDGFETHENNACSGREARFVATKDSEGGYLCLTGMVHATVTTMDIVFDLSSFGEPGLFQRHHQVMEMCQGIDLDNRKSDKMGVLARTLTVGYSTDDDVLEKFEKESFCAHNEKFIHYLEWCFAPMADSSNLRGDALQYQEAARLCCNRRRFFVTSDDDYGLGPACIREGDIVVVLYGGNAPYVLRPKGNNTYLMLGEAYVDSIMHGKLVKEVEEGKRQEQQFCLI